jgi:tetratricopeptide (TPR) repeat protein
MNFKIGLLDHRTSVVNILLSLICFSILAYGGEYPWHEAVLYAAVFMLVALFFFRCGAIELTRSHILLLIPLLLLSLYSLSQGFITLLTEVGFLAQSSLLPFSYDFNASIWCGIKILGFACFLALCFASVRRCQSRFVWGLVWIGNVFAILGVMRFVVQNLTPGISEHFIVSPLDPGIGFGTFLNQNHFATLMLMTLGLEIGLLVCSKLGMLVRILLVLSIFLVLVANILTASRAGIIGSFVVIGTLILIWTSRYKRRGHKEGPDLRWPATVARSFAVFGFISMILALGVLYVGQDRVAQRFAELPQQIEISKGNQRFRRVDVWKATAQLIDQHYVYGFGFGGFQYAVTEVVEITGNVLPKQSHNDYLEFIASGGLVSAGLGLLFIWQFISSAKKVLNDPSDGFLYGARIGALCGIIGAAFHGLFDFGLQYSGNLFFFGGLVAVVVLGSSHASDAITSSAESSKRWQGLGVGLLMLGLAGICCAFGISKYSLRPNNIALLGSDNKLFGLNTDPEYLRARATRFERIGEPQIAIKELKSATKFRPEDFSLWLDLARLENQQKRTNDAEASFNSAIKLAPFISEPHYYYGLFLIDSGNISKGVDELIIAAKRDNRILDSIVEKILALETEPAVHLHNLIEGETNEVRKKIFEALIVKRQFRGVVDLSCTTSAEPSDNQFPVYLLLENRQYRYAWDVYKHRCDNTPLPGEVINADFERTESGQAGFGWIFGDPVKSTSIAFDRTTANGGLQSLRFKFDGDFQAPLITQTVIVEKNRSYSFGFYYKSEGIIAGNLPFLQLALVGPNQKQIIKELEFKRSTADWTFSSTLIRTNDDSEALEINVTRHPCEQTECPIFGELWIDNFSLS